MEPEFYSEGKHLFWYIKPLKNEWKVQESRCSVFRKKNGWLDKYAIGDEETRFNIFFDLAKEKTTQKFTGNSFKLQGRGGLVFAVLSKYTQGK